MKRRVAKLRFSPNEEARLIQEERERRRKLRIQQVREQQRHIAMQIRQNVEQRRQREMEQLGEELREEWDRQRRDKLHNLQMLYEQSLQLIGQGHRSAKENEPDLAARAQKEEENHIKAEERFREALKELKSQRLKDCERQRRSINARHKALQTEKERSAKVASLPPPPPNPIQNIDSRKPHVVNKVDVSAFAATHYHMPETIVDREINTEQPNAHEGAEMEMRRLQDLQREDERKREEQLEKARVRGKCALKREQLELDRERLLVELEQMQQTDLLRRRQQVSQLPPQIFQPLFKRREMMEDFQREMEFAFEDIGERRIKGDLVVQLVPEPLLAPSTGSQDQELDVTLDEISTTGTENTQQDTEQEAGSTAQDTSPHAEPSRPPHRQALKKLLNRIRNQRNQWTDQCSRVPAADSLTNIPDQIPERDTTIDTGSLISEERDTSPPMKLPEPVHSPSEPPTAADTLLPDVLANRIQEFEEERKKRDVELEREKQQQMMLLQELEEQKDKLERMLLEAQQERDHLQAAVTHKDPIIQPEEPGRDQEVTHDLELVPPAGEEDNTSRIREYQQRLLQQNRVHQRSVEVARQRLEEYQRALQIHHNMSSKSFPPAVVPPVLVHPPLHGTRCVHFPTPLQLRTTSARTHAKQQTPLEVSTRESDVSAPPLHLPGSTFRVCSKYLPDEMESIGVSGLTGSIMERVTEHLPERLRPASVTTESLPYKLFKTHHSTTNLPRRPASDPIRAVGFNNEHTPLPDQVTVKGVLLHESRLTGSLRKENMERQRGDVQREAAMLQQSQQEEERLRVELQKVQREAAMLQQRQQEEERQRVELQKVQREAAMLQQRQQEEERQRGELQKVQREAAMLQQEEERKRREEQRKRQEVELAQMRQQKETLQALINTDERSDPAIASEVSVSEDIHQTRLRLLSSLLRAIEESHGGTLSHLEDPQGQDNSPEQQSSPRGETVLPSGLLPPHQAAKPPVTRFRLGPEMMAGQHELSAIQEVETPIDTSQVTGPEVDVKVLTQTVNWDLQEASDSSGASDRTLLTPSMCSSGHQTAERLTISRRSSQLVCRESLLVDTGTSPVSSEPESILRITSPASSDSGRGADYSGPAGTTFRSTAERTTAAEDGNNTSALRTPDSSTTISTGSYISTDPEQNLNTDRFTTVGDEEPGREADLLAVSSPFGQSSCVSGSPGAGHPGPALDSLFNDSSIQRIIDRYTKELNISMSTAGRTTDSEVSFVEERSSSVSQQSSVEASGSRREDGRRRSSDPLDTAGAQRSGLKWDSPALEHYSLSQDPSLTEDQGQDSFRPLIGQIADQSSCLAAEQRVSAMERLVGQPSAHSSMIGQLPGPLVSVSTDQDGFDSTLSRMIGRLPNRSRSRLLSCGQDFYAGQLISQAELEQSSSWLDVGPEESLMRPLVGELDESAGQQSASSGERTSVDVGVSTEAIVSSFPTLPPEASSLDAAVPGATPRLQGQTLQNQTCPMELGPQTEVFPGSNSFQPLLAEVTHNETADPSMTFHLPEHSTPNFPEGQPWSGENSVSTHSGSEPHADPSESELSPERFRSDDLTASVVLHDSISQLVTSQCRPQESALMLSDKAQDEERTAPSPSRLTVCDATPILDRPESQRGDPVTSCTSDPHADPAPPAGQLESEQGSHFLKTIPVSDRISEAAREKGILEQSQITLVSTTDTTLEDIDRTVNDEEDTCGDEHPGCLKEEQDDQEAEESESTLMEETSVVPEEDKSPTHPVMLLEFQWGPGGGLQEVHQQKRRALLHRSSRRLEDIKAKWVRDQDQAEIQVPMEAGEQSNTVATPPAICKAKTKTETQLQTNLKSKEGKAEPPGDGTNAKPIKQKKPRLPPPVTSISGQKDVAEVKISRPEQRKQDVSEMHKRTQRLYAQLEEVKHQKAVRSRQEVNAKNRQKAKEFQMKTLQKLRAKQTPL